VSAGPFGELKGQYPMLNAAKKLFSFIFLAAVVSTPMLLRADTPGKHPFYLHARSDLRRAQLLMRVHDDPDVMRRIHKADVEIDRAIHEMDVAAKFDRKDLEDHPAIDTNLDRPGRFRKVMELLQKARADIGRQENDLSAVGWRDAAYRHIDAAIAFVRRAAHDLQMEQVLGW
jgi:hypothetical protein